MSYRDDSQLDPSEVRDERGRGGLGGGSHGGRIAVGEDRIRSATQGGIGSEVWTHGSSRQRQTWLTTRCQTADVTKCDTFGGSL